MATQKEGKKTLREQQVEDRRKRMAKLNPPVERVRVTPANDDLRRTLKHPKGSVKFPEKGSVEWPLDQFTRRRIKEGSLKREDEKGHRERHEQAAQPQQPAQQPGHLQQPGQPQATQPQQPPPQLQPAPTPPKPAA